MFHPTKDFINICDVCKGEFSSDDISMHHICYPCWAKVDALREKLKSSKTIWRRIKTWLGKE